MNGQKPAVSVVVPVYNRRDVIGRAVRSLLTQDYSAPYEIIVVDDGSTDDSANVAASIDPRIRVIRQANQGAAEARHRGVVAAKGEAVCFLDSDNVAKPSLISSLWKGFTRRQDVALSYARVELADGRPLPGEALPSISDEEQILLDPLIALLRTGCFACCMNVMTSRETAVKCSKGRKRFLAANDYDFVLRAALHGPFAFVNEVTVLVEQRDDGISKSMGALQVSLAALAASEAVALSGRSDAAVLKALQARIEMTWPSAFVQLAAKGQWASCARLGTLGFQHARWFWSIRRVWWAIQHVKR